jgi:hypothetical protein
LIGRQKLGKKKIIQYSTEDRIVGPHLVKILVILDSIVVLFDFLKKLKVGEL